MRRAIELVLTLSLSALPAQALAQDTVPVSRLPAEYRSDLTRGRLEVVSPTRTDVVRPDATALTLGQQEFIKRRLEVAATDTLNRQAAIREVTRTCPRCEALVTEGEFVRVAFPTVGSVSAAGNLVAEWEPEFIHAAHMEFRQRDAVFAAPLFVAVRGTAGLSPGSVLPSPVTFIFLLPANLDADPVRVIVSRVGEYSPVELRAATPDDPTEITVLSGQFGVDTAAVSLSVRRPRLDLKISPRVIAGWGMEKATVTLTVDGGASSDYPAALEGVGGWLDETSLALSAAGSAPIGFRSRGVRGGTITAEHPQFESDTDSVTYVWPWAFLAGAVIGAILGFFAAFQKKKPGRGALWLLLGALGIGIGFSLVGIAFENLIGFVVPAPSLVHGAALGFVGSLFGYRILEKKLGLSASGPGGDGNGD